MEGAQRRMRSPSVESEAEKSATRAYRPSSSDWCCKDVWDLGVGEEAFVGEGSVSKDTNARKQDC